MERLVGEAEDHLVGIDILVNNVGGSQRFSIEMSINREKIWSAPILGVERCHARAGATARPAVCALWNPNDLRLWLGGRVDPAGRGSSWLAGAKDAQPTNGVQPKGLT